MLVEVAAVVEVTVETTSDFVAVSVAARVDSTGMPMTTDGGDSDGGGWRPV